LSSRVAAVVVQLSALVAVPVDSVQERVLASPLEPITQLLSEPVAQEEQEA
jgi:hypothetical protein